MNRFHKADGDDGGGDVGRARIHHIPGASRGPEHSEAIDVQTLSGQQVQLKLT
jgi:hypothetical protein